MAVHAIRVETSKISSGTPLDTVVGNVVASRRTVLPEQASEFALHEPTETEDLSEPYRAGLYRFPEEDYDRDELLDAFENALSSPPAKWGRIRYHRCSHDEENPSPCEWDEEVPPRIIGSPPAELPGPTSK